MNAKVSLNLALMNASALYTFGQSVVSKMTGNSNFSSPSPNLNEVAEALQNLQDSTAASLDGSKTAMALRNEHIRLVKLYLTQLGHYVEDTAAGDGGIIVSAGMSVKPPKGPTPLPDVALNLRLDKSDKQGEVILSWDKTAYARSFIIYENTDAQLSESAWTQKDVVCVRKYFLQNVDLTGHYAYRIVSVGIAGKSGASAVSVLPNWF